MTMTTMTRSDMMTAAAVTTGTPLEMNARTVVREDGVTTFGVYGGVLDAMMMD